MKIREIETNSNFYLSDCGICSGWTFNVRCKKTLKLGRIQISKCKDEPKFTVSATSLDVDCDIDKRDYPSSKDPLLQFLIENFFRIDSEDPCSEFHKEYPLCPTCKNDTIQDENELN